MLTGVIKFFDPTKNFGFILPHDGGKDVFFHRSAMEGTTAFNPGQWVQFELFESFPDNKPRAMKVALCGPKRVRSAAYGTD
jgi:cold shock protein